MTRGVRLSQTSHLFDPRVSYLTDSKLEAIRLLELTKKFHRDLKIRPENARVGGNAYDAVSESREEEDVGLD